MTRSASAVLRGITGVLAGIVWLVLTPFMSTTWNCDGVCADWSGQPLVVRTLGRWLADLGAFSPPVTSDPYWDYGRFFPLFYVLAVLTLAAFHRAQVRRAGRHALPLLRWSFLALLVGLVVSGTGDFAGYVLGRYVEPLWNVGWVVEFFAWLLVVPALVAYGVATLRQAVMPRWAGWALALAGVGMVLFGFDLWLVSYMPNAPLLPLAALCVALGAPLARPGGAAGRAVERQPVRHAEERPQPAAPPGP
ncbi:MAG TPA: hypothetical protein VFF08_05415 [Trueperaceae bacterium]|nr:hypothetical protein [Trueperaceae bacterium]